MSTTIPTSSSLLQATETMSQSTYSSIPTSTANDFGSQNTTIGSTLQQYYFSCISSWVLIALIFVFFTIRYFVRAKYGVNYVGLTRRGLYGYNHHVNGNNNGNQPPSSNIVNEHTFAQIFTQQKYKINLIIFDNTIIYVEK